MSIFWFCPLLHFTILYKISTYSFTNLSQDCLRSCRCYFRRRWTPPRPFFEEGRSPAAHSVRRSTSQLSTGPDEVHGLGGESLDESWFTFFNLSTILFGKNTYLYIFSSAQRPTCLSVQSLLNIYCYCRDGLA